MIVLLLLGVGTAPVAGPSPASANSTSKCSRSTLTTVKRFRTGALLVRRIAVGRSRVGQVYGCLYRVGRFVPLGSRTTRDSVAVIDSDGRLETGPEFVQAPEIVGRYAGYSQSTGEATPTSVVGVNVVDLKLGRLAGARDYGRDYGDTAAWDVERFVLKASGGIAWLGNEGDVYGIHKIDGPMVGTVRTNATQLEANGLNGNSYIDRDSLQLVDGSTRVSWALFDQMTGAPTVKTAPLG